MLGFLFVLVLVGIMFSMRKMGDPGGVPTPILESPQSVRDLEAALTAAGQGAALAGSADAQLAAAAMKSSRRDRRDRRHARRGLHVPKSVLAARDTLPSCKYK